MNEDAKWIQTTINEANIASGKDEIPVCTVLAQNVEKSIDGEELPSESLIKTVLIMD